jgi:hypothetical protein
MAGCRGHLGVGWRSRLEVNALAMAAQS